MVYLVYSAALALFSRCHGLQYRAGVIAHATVATKEKWWEKETPNMRNITGVQDLVDALVSALVQPASAFSTAANLPTQAVPLCTC